MRLKLLATFFIAGTVAACGDSTMSAKAENWIMDDGQIELTPEYNVQYGQGDPYAEVYAAFTFVPEKKLVRLQRRDTISVNGHGLEGQAHSRGYYYYAKIPVTDQVKTFTFTLSRQGASMSHRFELPALGIQNVPAVYQPYEMSLVPVRYVEPPDYVTKDRYTLLILLGDGFRFTLDSTKILEGTRYQLDARPNVEDGVIMFKPLTRRAPPPGMYQAVIHRQQHVVLSKMSDISRSGWATLNHALPFTIEVTEPSISP